MRSWDADLEAAIDGVEEVAVHLPDVPERALVLAACERVGARVVALDAGTRIVVTADGVVRDGLVVGLKDEVDAIVPGAERVIVLRRMGNAPLAATMDAYLDVTMIPGRDVWIESYA